MLLPCYPVAVVGCRVHGVRRYTLYPPGHYPYGRMAVVPASVDGKLLLDTDRGRPQWQATLFEAAQDAAGGRLWPSEQHWWERLDGRRRRTQGRRPELAGRLTGVSPELDEREREQIATRLAVPTMTVLSEARRWGRSWESRGAAIVAVLAALVSSATLGDRMGAAGAVSDLWGPPRPRLVARWEQTGKSWMVARSAVPEPRNRASPATVGERGPPATKAPACVVAGGATAGTNDRSRPPLPVSDAALLRYLVVAEVETLVKLREGVLFPSLNQLDPESRLSHQYSWRC